MQECHFSDLLSPLPDRHLPSLDLNGYGTRQDKVNLITWSPILYDGVSRCPALQLGTVANHVCQLRSPADYRLHFQRFDEHTVSFGSLEPLQHHDSNFQLDLWQMPLNGLGRKHSQGCPDG